MGFAVGFSGELVELDWMAMIGFLPTKQESLKWLAEEEGKKQECV